MKYIRALLVLSLLSFSLSSMALITQPPSGPVGPIGNVGGVGGGNGGAVGGGGGGGGGNGGVNSGVNSGVGLQPVEGQIAVIDLGVPQFGINDVTPTASGGCKVRGITDSGAWAGSPCEKLYGPTAP